MGIIYRRTQAHRSGPHSRHPGHMSRRWEYSGHWRTSTDWEDTSELQQRTTTLKSKCVAICRPVKFKNSRYTHETFIVRTLPRIWIHFPLLFCGNSSSSIYLPWHIHFVEHLTCNPWCSYEKNEVKSYVLSVLDLCIQKSVFLCGSVVEHCVSCAKGCGFDSQGTHVLIKMYNLNAIVSFFG